MIPRLSFVAFLMLTGNAGAQPAPTLKDTFKDFFRVGAALNRAQFEERDARGVPIIEAQFNTITPENVLKWGLVHPKPDVYSFEAADHYVAFGEKRGMFIVGHTLVWHQQTPAWVFQDENGAAIGRDALLKRLREHIMTVVGRYKGRIGGWDVVNEALNEDGTLRQSPWMKIIGEDYLVKAFEFVHEADPNVELYYNEYGIESEAKRNGAVALIRKLQARRVRVSAVGIQGHNNLERPTIDQVDAAIKEFAGLGIKVNITELDINVLPATPRTAEVSLNMASRPELNPYADGLPDAVQQTLSKRYAELFQLFAKHRGTLTRVTFWGVTDGDSWLNNWPVRGRTNYPLLFDRKGRPKPAFDAVIRAASRQ